MLFFVLRGVPHNGKHCYVTFVKISDITSIQIYMIKLVKLTALVILYKRKPIYLSYLFYVL
jgi:hypothetical protein